jgi:hypothetical protein
MAPYKEFFINPEAAIKDQQTDLQKEKTKNTFILLAFLLAFPFDIFEWTQDVLKIVLKNKKLHKGI